jgi:hypothetical protein
MTKRNFFQFFMSQILHYQLKLVYIASASIFYSEELFHQELSYHLKKWSSGISLSFSCPCFLTLIHCIPAA